MREKHTGKEMDSETTGEREKKSQEERTEAERKNKCAWSGRGS